MTSWLPCAASTAGSLCRHQSSTRFFVSFDRKVRPVICKDQYEDVTMFLWFLLQQETLDPREPGMWVTVMMWLLQLWWTQPCSLEILIFVLYVCKLDIERNQYDQIPWGSWLPYYIPSCGFCTFDPDVLHLCSSRSSRLQGETQRCFVFLHWLSLLSLHLYEMTGTWLPHYLFVKMGSDGFNVGV